ncbi:MAG: hypothetical protein OYH76_23530 [Defluviicoccus sp.]|nr:hypothetical protein [Defluviicoccus sp.]MDE0278878.1 hypothetical protein [Defluviicoccus sp.]
MGSGRTIRRYFATAVLAIALTGPALEAAAQGARPLPRPQNLSSHLPEFFRDLLGGRVWVANPRGRPAAAYFGEDGFVKRCYWSNAKKSFVFNRGELRWRIGTPNGRSNLEIGWVTGEGERFWRVVLIYDRETGRLHGERFNRKKRSWYVSRDGWIQDGWPAAFRNACHDLVLSWDLATVSGQDSLDFEDMRRNASPMVRFPGSEFSFPGATGLGDSKGKPTMTVEQIAEEERRAHGTIRITAQGRRIVGIRPRSGTVWELWELNGDDDVTDIGSIGPVGDGSVVRVRWEKSGLSAHLRVGYPIPALSTGRLHPAFAMMRDLAERGAAVTVDGVEYSFASDGRVAGAGGTGEWWLSRGQLHVTVGERTRNWPWRVFARRAGWKPG